MKWNDDFEIKLKSNDIAVATVERIRNNRKARENYLEKFGGR